MDAAGRYASERRVDAAGRYASEREGLMPAGHRYEVYLVLRGGGHAVAPCRLLLK